LVNASDAPDNGGGNHNLEVIWQYGKRVAVENTGGDASASRYDEEMYEFQPIFTIDTVITPEIFQPYGTGNTSTLFPDHLQTKKRDDDCMYCEV
jgi:hypothetical protein